MPLTNLVMVRNRLPFIAEPDADADLKIEEFRIEVVHSLKFQFERNELTDPEIEDEDNYDQASRSLIADIDSCYMIMRKVVANVGGVAGAAPSGAKFLKKGKAGTAEAEFAIAKASDGAFLGGSTESILSFLKREAKRKARNLGFIMDICEDCTLAIESFKADVLAFKVFPLTDC